MLDLVSFRFHPGRVAALMAVISLALTGCDSGPQQGQARSAPPPAVVVEPVRFEDITEQRTFTGRIEAIDKVQIRARVQGVLTEQAFKEGAEVKKGQVLFRIEREPYEIAVTQAEANLANADAALRLAKVNYDRALELKKRKVGTQATLDTARSTLVQTQATVKSRQAELRTAKLNLGYTTIEAPIDGRVGRAAYSVGNFVNASSNPLITLVAQDPMYVAFPVPQQILLEVRKAGQGPNSVVVRLRLADGSRYAQVGQIAFSAVQATSSTDTVLVRARIPNPERILVDQQLVNVLVVSKEPEKKLVISQSAMLIDQQGPYVLAVAGDNKVSIKRIKTGPQRGGQIIVTAGLKAGEKVIVSGHQKVRPGQQVSPSQADAATGTGKGAAKGAGKGAGSGAPKGAGSK